MVILDLNVLGFSIFVFICIKVKVGMYGYVVDQFKKYFEICEVYEIIDDYDMIVKIRIRSSLEFNEFFDKMGSIEGVDVMYMMVVFKVYKEIIELLF